MAPFPLAGDTGTSVIFPRQSTNTFVAIPATYGSQHSSPSPGAVAGIVLGSVAAFILLLYIVYAILHGGPVLFRKASSESSLGSRSVVSFRTATRAKKRSSRVSETTEIHSRERVSPPEAPRGVSPVLTTEESVDEVVVIEEHTPPPSRGGSRRHSGYRRDSGYRDVDPGRFAGDDEPVREARREVRREVRYSRGSRG
ncbi:Fc.00g089390.m01.CDS01 [Cosmosporella sp. VM-42]